MKSIFVILLLTISLFAKAQYVTDSFEITLRKSPSNSAKIIAMPKSGDPVTIIGGDGEWLHVRVKGTDKKGWVMKRYITPRVPFENQFNYINGKHIVLKDSVKVLLNKIAEINSAKNSIQKELNTTKKEFKSIEGRYKNLYNGSSDYLGLQADYELAVSVKDSQIVINTDLIEKNEELSSNFQNRWFLTGALVVLISYLLGRTARKEKSRRRF